MSVLVLSLPQLLRDFGWHVTTYGGGVAPDLVRRHRPASECWNIIFLNLTPSPQQVRVGCIVQYASITRDPSVCELLMPGKSGLDCINYVAAQEYKDDNEAAWVKEEDCSSVTGRSLKQDHCTKYKAHRSHDPRDCDTIDNDVLRTGCRLKMEAWHKYPELRSSLEFGKYRQE